MSDGTPGRGNDPFLWEPYEVSAEDDEDDDEAAEGAENAEPPPQRSPWVPMWALKDRDGRQVLRTAQYPMATDEAWLSVREDIVDAIPRLPGLLAVAQHAALGTKCACGDTYVCVHCMATRVLAEIERATSAREAASNAKGGD